MFLTHRVYRVALLIATACMLSSETSLAAIRIKDICRVKGQEENALRGLGLVVGLGGTGDGGAYQPMIRSLGTALQLMGNPISKSELQREMKDTKNVALVVVEATVPAAGAREGDKLDCYVSSFGSAKSLAGGRLFMAPLKGPKAESSRVYAFAQGAVRLENPRSPTTGKIDGGCQLVEEFINVFSMDGKITLVLDKNHADFTTAWEIADTLANFATPSPGARQPGARSYEEVEAVALNAMNVVVSVPQQYLSNPVPFVSLILELPLRDPKTEARVVIDRESGSIAVGGDVEIAPSLVQVNDVVVNTAAGPGGNQWVQVQAAKLEDLVTALNAIQATPETIVGVIRALDKAGNLYGRVIIE